MTSIFAGRATRAMSMFFRRWNIGAACSAVALCLEKRRQRNDLMELDECQLKDIGLARRDAALEASKSFWLYKAWR